MILTCPECNDRFEWLPRRGGHKKFCSALCCEKAYRKRPEWKEQKARYYETQKQEHKSSSRIRKGRSFGNNRGQFECTEIEHTPATICRLSGDKFLRAAQSIIDRDVRMEIVNNCLKELRKKVSPMG